MIGGMVSSTLLTLIVIPAVYALVKGVNLRAGSPEPVRQTARRRRRRRAVAG